MRNEKHIEWLYLQLPKLQQSGVVDEATALRLREHYGPVDPAPAYNLAFIIAGVLGALLIGGGIIMLFAYNWDQFPVTTRAVLSFIPLLVALGIYVYVFLKKRHSTAWVEASAGFLMLMLASTIALVSDVYELQGTADGFLLTWLLLSIPLLYVMNASLPALMYLIGIAGWAIEKDTESSVFYWLLLAAAIPHLVRNVRRDAPTLRSNLLSWTLLFSGAFAWFTVVETRIPENLLIGTALMLSFIYFLGWRLYPSSDSGIWQPYRTFAIGGLFIMCMTLGYEWPDRWEDFRQMFTGRKYPTAYALGNLLVILSAAVGLIYLFWTNPRPMRQRNWWVATFPLMIIVGAVLARNGQELPAIILANLFLLGFGIYYIREGIQLRKLSLINVGMLFLTAMIVARFFDADLNLIWKGIVFILLGVGFLSVNVIMSRRLKKT